MLAPAIFSFILLCDEEEEWEPSLSGDFVEDDAATGSWFDFVLVTFLRL